jgi:hypothetical protein
MAWTIAAAFVVTPTFGVLAHRLHDEVDVQRERAEDFDARLREDLLKLGFQPLRRGAAGAESSRLSESTGIELLAAERAFSLEVGVTRLVGQPAPAAASALAARVIREELIRYPRSFLAAIHLERVVLCATLSEGQLAIPSLPNYAHSLIVDTASSEPFLRRLIHHEVFHFADFADDGNVRSDLEWERLNSPDFNYAGGGRQMREPGSARFDLPFAGFVSRYATAAVEEDKAELFAFAMTAPHARLRDAKRDAVIQKKLVRLETTLARIDPKIRALFER